MKNLTPKQLLTECISAGNRAALNARPLPTNGIPTFESEGPCGYAQITIRPARGAFVSYLKANNIGSKGVYGGYTVSAYNFLVDNAGTQSLERKEAACEAVAEILTQAGLRCNATARMD